MAMRAASQPQTYQLFRHGRREDLWCAVPCGQSLPQVFEATSWKALVLTSSGSGRPPGFDEDAAAYSCSVQGFYVFHWGGRTAPRPRSRALDRATGVQMTL
jgi:CubicO group peptidase (beta-lactamase class C family)